MEQSSLAATKVRTCRGGTVQGAGATCPTSETLKESGVVRARWELANQVAGRYRSLYRTAPDASLQFVRIEANSSRDDDQIRNDPQGIREDQWLVSGCNSMPQPDNRNHQEPYPGRE